MRRMLIVAVAGLLAANVAWAQRGGSRDARGPQVNDYAPSIEASEWLNVVDRAEIPSLSELRGMIVVVFFWSSWQEGGENLLPYVNVLSYSGWGETPDLYFIGVTDAERGATQPLIEDAKIFFPVAVGSHAAEEYGFSEGYGFAFVVIDPEGRIQYKNEGSRGSTDINAVVNAVNQIRENTPPTRTHPNEARICQRLLDQACDLMREGRNTQAYAKGREAFVRSVLGDRLQSRTLELADLMELMGYDRLAGVDPLLEQRKYDEAAELLREVIRRFRKLDCYKDAKARFAALTEEDENFKRAAAKYDNEDQAARLYLEARDLLKNRRFGESYDRLNQIMTEYPATQAAEYAEAMADRMKQNKAFWAQVRDHLAAGECQSMLARARVLITQGRLREAETLLRRVADEYADTVWAEEAVEELKKLPDLSRHP